MNKAKKFLSIESIIDMICNYYGCDEWSPAVVELKKNDKYIKELEKKLNPDCSTCKWNETLPGGIGSDYHCGNCMDNKYEPIED